MAIIIFDTDNPIILESPDSQIVEEARILVEAGGKIYDDMYDKTVYSKTKYRSE